MENYRLQKDKEFKKVCMLLSYDQENYAEIKRVFVKAFTNWYAKLDRINLQLQKVEKRKNELTYKEYNELKDYIEGEKSKITNTYIEKFCAIIDEIPTTINGIEKIVALILKDCMSNQVRRVENWIVNTEWVNNQLVMTTIIEEKGKTIDIVPEKLANNSEFMLHFVYLYTCTKHQWGVYRKIGEELKYDINFVIEFLKTLVAKYKSMDNLLGLKQDFFQIIKTVYDDKRLAENVFIYENYDFWNAVKELKLHEELDNKTLQSMVKKFTMYYDEDAKKDVIVQKTLNERIEYLVQNPDTLSRYQRDDYVLMIKLIKLNPALYVYASDRLKVKTSFANDAIKSGVDEDVTKNEKNKIVVQRAKEKIISTEASKLQRRKKFENQFGICSVNYQKVEEYLYSSDSFEDFCLKRKVNKSEFKKIFDTVCKLNPEIASRRDERSEILQKELKEESIIVIDKLINDELYIYQFAKENTSLVKINSLVIYATDKKKIIELIFNAIISKKFSVNDYIRLFSFDYESAIKKIYKFIRYVEREYPEWEGLNNYLYLVRKEIAGLVKYETEYRDCDFLGDKRGVTINEETKLVEITEERLEEIFKYLEENDEYLCNYTVNEAIKKFINVWID